MIMFYFQKIKKKNFGVFISVEGCQMYEFLDAYQGRGELPTDWHRIRLGIEGESYVRSIIEPLVPRNVLVIFDCWLEHFGSTQIDVLIVFPDKVYLINVKNYQFELQASDDFSKKMSRQIINQLNNSRSKLRDILIESNGSALPIETVLMFANEKQMAPLPEPKADETVLHHEISFWFNKLLAEHEPWHSINKMKQMREGILSYQCEPKDSRWFKGMTHEEICQKLKLGLRCPSCRAVGKMVKCNQRMYACGCGNRIESREAILTGIDDYLALRVTNRFTRKEIQEFMTIPQSRNMSRLLKKHFKLIDKNKYSYYVRE